MRDNSAVLIVKPEDLTPFQYEKAFNTEWSYFFVVFIFNSSHVFLYCSYEWMNFVTNDNK